MGSDEPHFSGLWEVFEGYEIRVPGDGAPYLEAVGEMKKSYRPLADTPFLFLAFARLADQPATEEVLRSWIEEYGLLGVHYDDGRPYLPVYYPEPATPPLMYDTQGGPGENLMYFWASAQEANRVLSLYEAALNRNEEKLERLLGGPDVVQRITKNYLGDILAMSLLTQTEMPRDQIMSVADLMVDKALMRVWHVVQDRLSSFAYPTINHELPLPSALPHFHKGAPLSPHRLGASWGFRNLIGAMYLQFYWLITSRADIKRCKYCGRVISLAPPTTPDGKKGRKPRSDKEYCNKSCQQNYDYHKRRKHKNKS
jgi:hypothetical protein